MASTALRDPLPVSAAPFQGSLAQHGEKNFVVSACLQLCLQAAHLGGTVSLSIKAFPGVSSPPLLALQSQHLISSLVFRGMYLHTFFTDAQIRVRAKWESSKASLSREAALQAAEALSFFQHCLQRQQLLGLSLEPG